MSNQTPIVFKGDAGDYFGIWMVNLLLSMLYFGYLFGMGKS